jgi:oligoribonuclease NrnB/cAMP/cGMP phosphodiesterase (DHH superfamily)
VGVAFEVKKERIVTDAKFFLFKPFVDIWEWDKSERKDKAHAMLRFIFLLCDITEECQLKDVAFSKREAEALFHAYKDKNYKFTKKERALVEAGVACYIKYNESAEERLLDEFDHKAEELRGKLEDTMPEAITNVNNGVTTFVSNSEIITRALKELDTVKKSKISVISAIKREALTQRVRGAASLSPNSRGLINVPTMADRDMNDEITSV